MPLRGFPAEAQHLLLRPNPPSNFPLLRLQLFLRKAAPKGTRAAALGARSAGISALGI